jgi:hypothetical protein
MDNLKVVADANTVFLNDRSDREGRRLVVTKYRDGSGHIKIFYGKRQRAEVSLNREDWRHIAALAEKTDH